MQERSLLFGLQSTQHSEYNFLFSSIKNWFYSESVTFFFPFVLQVKFPARTYTKFLSVTWLGEALNDLWSHLWLPRSSLPQPPAALPLCPLLTHSPYLVWKLKKLQAEHVKNCWVSSPQSSVHTAIAKYRIHNLRAITVRFVTCSQYSELRSMNKQMKNAEKT